MNNKKVLLTGSEGFLGSYLCDELLMHGYSIVGIDNFSKYGRVNRIHREHENFQFIELDLENDKSDILSEFYKNRGFDFVIHTAAKIGGISYFHKYAYDLVASNERITDHVLSSLINLHKKGDLSQFPRFVYLSSSMVYENVKEFPSKEDSIDRYAPPSSSYGFQKLMGEIWVRAAHDQYGLPYTIIRPFNAVGIGEEDDFSKIKNGENCSLSHVLPDFVYKALIKQTPFKILGDGKQTRCLTNCRDIARGIRLSMESPVVNETFNISTPWSIQMLELAKIVWRVVNGDDSFISEFKPEFVEGFKNDVQERTPATEKALNMLGFRAEISLKDSIKEVVEFIKEKVK